MRNTFYYIILCVVSSLLFSYTLWRKKDNKLLALYFFIAGYVYLLEYFVLVIFNGYSYNPHIFKNDYYDNIAGAVVSDAFVIPMISTFVAGFKFSFMKRLFIAAFITLIEIIFVRMSIFEVYWWKDFYTFAGAVITFYIAQKWLSILRGKINDIVRFVNLFFYNMLIQCSISSILVCILDLFFYNIHWFNNPYRSHDAFATLYIMFITAIFVTIVVFHLNWFWRVFGVLLPSISDVILLKVNILSMSGKWSLFGFLIYRIIIFICILLFNRYLLTFVHEIRKSS